MKLVESSIEPFEFQDGTTIVSDYNSGELRPETYKWDTAWIL